MPKYTYTNKRFLIIKRKDLRNNSTKAERILWKHIRVKQLGIKFRRQFSVDSFITDFCAPSISLIIELDGWIHGEKEQREKDFVKQKRLEANGYVVKRYRNEQIKYDIEAVLQDLIHTIETLVDSKDPS